MPYKSDRIKIVNTKHDRRIKLTLEERESIVEEHKQGQSQRNLAKKYNVSRRTIYNTIYPEKYREQLELYKRNKHSNKYYNKDYQNKKIKEHRKYKHQLYLKGEIK